MATVTPQGIEPTTLDGYVAALGAAFRTALGQDLNLEPETPQGQLIGVLAVTLAEADEALVAVANGVSRDRALGIQLDDLGSLLGVPRLEGESDDDYRARYGRLTARNARGSIEAILAAVLSVDGVTDALIRENNSAAVVSVQGKDIGAHSICVVVDGGADADVAAAVARSKPAGTGTSGDSTVDVSHVGGWTVSTAFSRITPVPIKVTMELALDAQFPSDGTSRIIQAAVAHVDRLPIAEHLSTQRLLADVLSVPGHTVPSFGVGRKAGTVITGTGTVASLTTLQSITSGSITLLGQTASGLDFYNETDYDGVASVVQTALRSTSETDLDQVEVAYVDGAFVVTVPLDEDGEPVNVTGALTGDAADDLGLDTVSTVQGSVTSQDDLDLAERLTLAAVDATITTS